MRGNVGFCCVAVAAIAWWSIPAAAQTKLAEADKQEKAVDATLPPEFLPVSKRLKRELVHPKKKGALYGLAYSPDGKKLIAGDYPGGVVQVWDIDSGKPLKTMEAGYGYRADANYLQLTRDWRTMFVATSLVGQRPERVEVNGKDLYRWTFNSDVRAWDLNTGEVTAVYRHTPSRGIIMMELAPDDSHFITLEEMPGEYEGRGPRVVSKWNVKSQEQKDLPVVNGVPTFSPDGKILAETTSSDDGRYVTTLRLFDVATMQERAAMPLAQPFASYGGSVFSPDNKLLVSTIHKYAGADEWRTFRTSFKLHDVSTGNEVATFNAEQEKNNFSQPVFAPDASRLLVIEMSGGSRRLHFLDVPKLAVHKTIELDKNSRWSQPVFSPDGRWIALTTQQFPANVRDETPVEDLPQPRIHLIDAVNHKIVETLISPPAMSFSICFSPDGKTLATGGNGRVLLWDLAKAPGSVEGSSDR